ncbi:MAG TPA: glycoside hydrolase 100 family protein [Myxococcota bacterium]|nr:glycoside hydrolase 100 family protein [Myxococcota bacterium]
MTSRRTSDIDAAKGAALEVLLHNAHGPFNGLPRTAGWGYPECYTRDMMIAGLGVLTSGDARLIARLGRVLEALAKNQSPLGHIPSLAHDPEDRGASDTTPLFLMTTALYRRVTCKRDFLAEAVERSLRWMDYQSPSDRVMVAQLPTSDWRDEQWVLGFGLFVNTVVYSYLRLFGRNDRAKQLFDMMRRFTITGKAPHRHVHEGLAVRHKPYYALWSYKVYESERFDLLGNSLAILSGLASHSRANALVTWIEHECDAMRKSGDLAVDLPPNFFPYIRPEDPDWRPRYEEYNRPGEYHNGGVWPFVCGFYVAALVAAGRHQLARRKLAALTALVTPAREHDVAFGFNEWFRATDGAPCGQDWQTWSAAMYLYAAACVERKCTPFFDDVRNDSGRSDS